MKRTTSLTGTAQSPMPSTPSPGSAYMQERARKGAALMNSTRSLELRQFEAALEKRDLITANKLFRDLQLGSIVKHAEEALKEKMIVQQLKAAK